MTAYAVSVVLDIIAAPDPQEGIDTNGLAEWLRQIFAPLFLVIVSIAAIFHLFTHAFTKFVQFVVIAVAIGVVFYVPGIIETTARAIAAALGVET